MAVMKMWAQNKEGLKVNRCLWVLYPKHMENNGGLC
jgi:hypothetical protein